MQKQSRRLAFVLAAAMLVSILLAALTIHINAFALAETQIFRPVVALVNFSDSNDPFDEENRGDFEAIFNSAVGGVGEANLQSYLRTLSRGKIEYQSQFVILELDKPASHYRDWKGGGLAPIFTEAIQTSELADFVNGVNADADGDGKLDGLTFYVNAATSDPSAGQADAFWPHQATNSVPKQLGNYEVSKYMVVPRSIEGRGESDFLQVICHETLHMFGADDLYHYANTVTGCESNPDGYEDLYPVGIWDIMGNPMGYDDPISVNTYYRRQAGFLDDTEFCEAESGQTYEILPSLSQERGVLGLKFGEKSVNGRTEFFVIEYRDIENGYDAALGKVRGLSSGYTLYRVSENETGNRLEKNGDEILYFDQNLSGDLKERSSYRFSATFQAPAMLSGFCYSDGSACDFEVTLSAEGATVDAIEQNFRLEVRFGTQALDGFVVRADGEILSPSSEGIFTARRGSQISVQAEGYVLPEGNFALADTEMISLAAYREKSVRFSVGENGVAGILGKVSGTDRSYTSDENGLMKVLLEPGETVEFSAHGYEFGIASYTLSDDLAELPVVLTPLARNIVIAFSGAEISGNVLVSVNGGESVEKTIENNVLTLENVKNGDRIQISQEDFEFEEVIVSHLVADGDFVCNASGGLLRIPLYWLAVPAVLFLLIAIFALAHDYKRKRK